MRIFRACQVFLCAVLLVLGISITGCTKKPSGEELSKLQDQRNAAESAEKKLSELRQERAKLEKELESKQAELQARESERDELDEKAPQ